MLVPLEQTVEGIASAVSMWLSGRQHLDRQVGKVSLMASLMSEMLRPCNFVATQLLICRQCTQHRQQQQQQHGNDACRKQHMRLSATSLHVHIYINYMLGTHSNK